MTIQNIGKHFIRQFFLNYQSIKKVIKVLSYSLYKILNNIKSGASTKIAHHYFLLIVKQF